MSSVLVLELVLKGIAMGFLAAAPTGPSGVLVIQRTLDKGRLRGFLTGMGVTISDVVYIMVTMMCLSLVIGYLEDPKVSFAVKLVGCGLLLCFGISTVRNNPLAKSKDESVRRDSLPQYTLTGLLVAIVNPLVVFIYMGLFAFFSFGADELSAGLKGILLASAVAGDVLWWFSLSFVINKLRNRFSLKGIWMINRVLGIVLIAASAVWLVTLIV